MSGLIGDLPAGAGFTITLTGTASDGATTCGGSATFAVVAGQTTAVSIDVTCNQAAATGSAQVTGTIDVCPTLAGVTATPQEVLVGGTVALSATASDPDDGPSPLAYQWTATTGTFDDAAAATPTFTCAQAGAATITVAVSDGDASGGCAGLPFSITVTCTPATADVQAIVDAHCTSCHGATNPSAGMSLVDVRAQIGVPSGECGLKDRITSGSSATSYLVEKILGAAQDGACFSGQRMPRGAPALAAGDTQLIQSWIDARTP